MKLFRVWKVFFFFWRDKSVWRLRPRYAEGLDTKLTLALSDQPKDWTVTSRRFSNIFLLTSYSFTRDWLITSSFSWKEKKENNSPLKPCKIYIYFTGHWGVKLTQWHGPRVLFIRGWLTWWAGTLDNASFSWGEKIQTTHTHTRACDNISVQAGSRAKRIAYTREILMK